MLRSLCCCLVLVALPTPWLHGQSPPQHILLICIDDLRPELNCYGVDYIRSPHIDQLASDAIRFDRHYVQAPTCGASRFALLTGRYGGPSNNALFNRAKNIRSGQEVPASLPAWFRSHGYTTVSVGKVSHHPGGHGGPDWNDPHQQEMPDSWDRQLLPVGPWQHPRGWMHGLAHGEIRMQAAKMDVFQALPGDDSIYPDGASIAEALHQIDLLSDAQSPFFLACGILRPHLPFGAPEHYLTPYRDVQLPPIPHPEKPVGQTTWHGSGEFNQYNRWGRDPNRDPEFAAEVRKHYAACVSYADAQVGKLIDKLKQRGLWERTIVVLWGDHGWHLGEHAVWGKHTLFEESLRAPLIVRYPGMPRQPSASQQPLASQQIVQTVDLFPTLCELTTLPVPEFVVGRSLVAEMQHPNQDDRETFAIGYQPRAKTIRNNRFRLIAHQNGHVELYDHDGQGEIKNVAAQFPEMVAYLQLQLDRQLQLERHLESTGRHHDD